MHKKSIIKNSLFALAVITVTACSSTSDIDSKAQYPSSPEDKRRIKHGKMTGEGGLLSLGKKSDDSGEAGIGINSYLWRASLDTLSFMPLASADPFGGVIITDWYEDPAHRGERFKVNVVILDRNLSANALKVSVFKQASGKGGWVDSTASEQVVSDIESKILTRARELRVEKESSDK